MAISGLSFDWAGVARIWKNANEIVKESGEGYVFVVGEKEINLKCSLQPASEMGPSTSLTDHDTAVFLECAVETGIVEERQKSIQSDEKNEKCVKRVATNM